jgi:hypothetical protein
LPTVAVDSPKLVGVRIAFVTLPSDHVAATGGNFATTAAATRTRTGRK